MLLCVSLARAKHGLLEKHKDYVQRARRFQRQKAVIEVGIGAHKCRLNYAWILSIAMAARSAVVQGFALRMERFYPLSFICTTSLSTLDSIYREPFVIFSFIGLLLH